MREFWEKVFMAAFLDACESWHPPGASKMAIEAADQAVAACRAITEPLGPSEEGGWISVKDRLPDKDGVVLIYARRSDFGVLAECVDTVFYDEVVKGFPVGRSRQWLDAITHWMPLPDPPEEESVFVSIPCRGCSCCKSRGLTPLPDPPEATP